jgi:protein subunit release factor A
VNSRRIPVGSADRNGRRRRYDLPPGRVDQVLREIESDPTSISWG